MKWIDVKYKTPSDWGDVLVFSPPDLVTTGHYDPIDHKWYY